MNPDGLKEKIKQIPSRYALICSINPYQVSLSPRRETAGLGTPALAMLAAQVPMAHATAEGFFWMSDLQNPLESDLGCWRY